jgi:hypothetical protein
MSSGDIVTKRDVAETLATIGRMTGLLQRLNSGPWRVRRPARRTDVLCASRSRNRTGEELS